MSKPINRFLAYGTFFLIFTFLLQYSYAQETISRFEGYKAKVNNSENLEVEGSLYKVTDTTVILAVIKKGYYYLDTIPFNIIQNIYLVKNTSRLMGGAIGLLVSDIIGLILMMPPSEYDEEGYKKSINIGLVTLFVANPIACFLGAAIGDGSGDNYPINYDYNQFQATKRQLSKRALH